MAMFNVYSINAVENKIIKQIQRTLKLSAGDKAAYVYRLFLPSLKGRLLFA